MLGHLWLCEHTCIVGVDNICDAHQQKDKQHSLQKDMILHLAHVLHWHSILHEKVHDMADENIPDLKDESLHLLAIDCVIEVAKMNVVTQRSCSMQRLQQ